VVGPARRREAVAHLQQSFEAGERRACRVVEQPRSTQRYEAKRPAKDRDLIADLRRIAGSEPRAGYRQVTRLLRREGWQVNKKRVHRLWKQEGLKVPCRRARKRRRGSGDNSCQKRCATHLNHVWSYDFIHDQTVDGGRLKWLPIMDEFSREVLSLEVARSITAQDVVKDLDRLVSQRGAPEFIRSDNGPEFAARAVKDWIAARGFQTAFIEPGSPWQNAYSESFNSRFRDEFLNLELFGSLLEAKVLGEAHRYKYNHQRPHSSLGDLTPAEYASRCPSPLRPPACAPKDSETQHEPELS
jgi:transposase InsO family protein